MAKTWDMRVNLHDARVGNSETVPYRVRRRVRKLPGMPVCLVRGRVRAFSVGCRKSLRAC
eukprot:4163553-Lingulodinium_polyedra.AAC.1